MCARVTTRCNPRSSPNTPWISTRINILGSWKRIKLAMPSTRINYRRRQSLVDTGINQWIGRPRVNRWTTKYRRGINHKSAIITIVSIELKWIIGAYLLVIKWSWRITKWRPIRECITGSIIKSRIRCISQWRRIANSIIEWTSDLVRIKCRKLRRIESITN